MNAKHEPRTATRDEKEAEQANRRSSVRFRPDRGAGAQIDLRMKGEFTPELHALLQEEAAKGCCLVTRDEGALKVGDVCLVKVGRLDAIKAQVRWRKEIDAGTFKIGLMYLE